MALAGRALSRLGHSLGKLGDGLKPGNLLVGDVVSLGGYNLLLPQGQAMACKSRRNPQTPNTVVDPSSILCIRICIQLTPAHELSTERSRGE